MKLSIHIEGKELDYASLSRVMLVTEGDKSMIRINTDLKNKTIDECVMTYSVYCPYIFGDEAYHNIVVYWEVEGQDTPHFSNRIIFNGNEVPVHNLWRGPMAHIVIDR